MGGHTQPGHKLLDHTSSTHTPNPTAHDPCLRVNNPTLCAFCYTTLGRADIEESKSGVDMSSWPPQASYPCGNFSDTTNLDFVKR